MKIKLPPKPADVQREIKSDLKIKTGLANSNSHWNITDAFSPFWSSREKVDEIRNTIMDLYENPKPMSPPSYLDPPKKVP